VLGELETRLQDLSQIVLGGRRELMRVQGKDTPSTSGTSNHAGASHGDSSQAMDANAAVRARAQQAAARLRRAAGGRLAS
jgi:hypothetical protein